MSAPGSPWCTSTSPAVIWRIFGLAALCISCTDSARSSAVSTAVTSATESSSPHGLCRPNDLRYQSRKSVRPDLCDSCPHRRRPSAGGTGWHRSSRTQRSRRRAA